MPEGTRIDRLYYEIDAEVAGLIKGLGTASTLVNRFAATGDAATRSTKGLGLAALQAAQSVRQMGGEVDTSAKSASRLQTSFSGVGRAIAGLGAALGLRQLVEYADTWTLVTNRLRLVTESSENLTAVQRQLFESAQDTRSAYAGTADIFTRLARNSEELEQSQESLLGVTETINKAIRIANDGPASANAAIVQLSQAFSSGVLRGEEFNSVMEQTPRLAEAIAKGMGVTIGQLRKLAESGALTSKAVVEALKSQAATIDAEFQQMTGTVSESFTQLRNSALRWIGEASEATGASVTLAGGLSLLARNFTVAANAAALFAAAAIGRSLSGAVDRVRALAGAQVAAAAAAEKAAAAQARAALTQAVAEAKQAVATERNIAATVQRLRVEQAALARAAQRARADLAAARAAEADAAANVTAARSADARALAETRLSLAITRRTRASAALRGVEAQQVATNRLIGQNLVLLGNAQNGAAAAAAKSGAAFTGFARTLTGVSAGARLAAVGMTAFRTVVAFFGGPVIAGIIAGIVGISTALGLVKKNAAVAKEEMERFSETLGQETLQNLLTGQARVLDQIAEARRRATDPRATQGQRSAAADEVPRLQELLKAYKDVIAAKRESAEVRTPQGDLDAEAKTLADLIRLGQANNKERERAGEIIKETQRSLALVTGTDTKSQEARIRLQERINLLANADSKQRKEAAKDAEALQRVLERTGEMEMQVSGADDLARTRVELNKLAADARDAGLAGEALRAFEERLQAIYQTAKDRSVEEMSSELRDLAAAMTITAADDLANEIDKLEEKFKGATGETRKQADAVIKAKREMRDAALAAEQLARKLEQLRDLNAGGARTNMAAMSELLALRDAEEVNLRGAKTDEERERIKARIHDIDKEIADLQDRTAAAVDEQRRAESELESTTQRVAGAVENVANAAFGIVSAFQGSNSELARMLGSIGQVAGGLSKLAALAKEAGGFKELFGSGTGIAKALGPMGAMLGGALAIGSLFMAGEDPETARRREANTKALEDLTRAVGSLDLGDTGANRNLVVGFAQSVIEGWARQLEQMANDEVQTDPNRVPLAPAFDLDAWLRRVGLSFEEFRRQAEALGVGLPKSLKDVSFKNLEEIARAAATVGVQFALLQEKFKVLDTAPADRLAATLALIAEKGDQFARALAEQVGGYDLATEAGRRAAEAAVRAAFELENSPISATLATELLGLIGDVTEAARTARAGMIRGAKDEIDFRDIEDAAPQLERITRAYGAQIPILAQLYEGLDLTTKEGLTEFDRRLQAFYDGVKDGSIALDGFTVDEVIAALFDMEGAADRVGAAFKEAAEKANEAAEAAAREAEAKREATRALNESLDVRELRAGGDESGASRLERTQQFAAEIAKAVADGVEEATIERLKRIQAGELAQFDAQQAAAAAAAAESAAQKQREATDRSTQRDVGERITERTANILADIARSDMALSRARNETLSRILASITRSITTTPLPAPRIPAALLGGGGSGDAGRNAGATSGGARGGGVVVQTGALAFNFYGPVTGDGAEIGRTAAAAFRDQVRTIGEEIQAQAARQSTLRGDNAITNP